MVSEYFENSVQFFANELHNELHKEIHNYLMITLKIEKVICPGYDAKNTNRAFRR